MLILKKKLKANNWILISIFIFRSRFRHTCNRDIHNIISNSDFPSSNPYFQLIALKIADFTGDWHFVGLSVYKIEGLYKYIDVIILML